MPKEGESGWPPSMEEALVIARKHDALVRVLKGRGRALFVERIPSARHGAAAEQRLLVGVYDYEEDRSLVAVIDPRRKTVESVAESPTRFQLSDEERADAEELAAADPRVRTFIGAREMRPLTRLYFPRDPSAEASHRHAIVFLRPDNRQRRYAVVDLSARRVVDVITRAEFTGEQR